MFSAAARSGRILGLPWWLAVTIVFAAGRLITTLMLAWYATHQEANAWTGATPPFLDFSSIWDGRWYNLIAEHGYPKLLPHDAQGHVAENSWAFLPLYPMICKAIMVATGLSWNVVAIWVSVICGLVATLVIYRLFVHFLPAQQALFAIVLLSVAPASPMFQVAYAEALQLMLIAIALLLLVRRRYLAIIPVVLLLGFTRPGALALALTLGLYGVFRFARRKRNRFPAGERWRLLAAIVASVIAGFAWMGVAAWFTGVPDAYLQTELTWRAGYIGFGHLVPFTPWVLAAQYWWPGLTGYLVFAGVVALFALVVFAPASKRLGLEMRLWMFSYAVYLLAVFFPQSSTVRLLLPMFPALGMFAAPKSPIYRVALVVAFAVAQWFWIGQFWAISENDWTPP
jgi:hypothetical protein